MGDLSQRTGGNGPGTRRRILGLGGLTLACCVTLAAGGLAWAGFKGHVADSVGTFSAGTMLLKGTTPVSVTCTSSSTVTPISTNSASCPGDPLPTGTLSTTASSAVSTLSDPGTTNPTASTVSSPSCGVQQLIDADAHDTGLAMGGVTYGQTGPISGTGIAFDGSTGWFETTSSYSAPGAFTLLAWFKAGSGSTGTIFSLSNSQFNSGASSSDLNLWVNSSGKLVWGVVTLGALGIQLKSEVTSSTTVTDGNWHLAAATYSGLTSTLYLDGSSAGSVLAVTGLGSFTGYASVGWGPEGATGWAGAPTSAYFGGSLSMVSLSPSAASSGQISTLAGETSATNYESALTTDAPSSENWEMTDSGSTPFTGTVNVSGGGTTTPCQRVEVTVQQVQGASTTCAVPAGGSPCPAPANPPLLSSLSTAAAIDVPTTSAAVQLTIKFALTAASPVGVAGLHLLPHVTLDASRTSWSAGLAYASASVEL
jgi:hypothetical protein